MGGTEEEVEREDVLVTESEAPVEAEDKREEDAGPEKVALGVKVSCGADPDGESDGESLYKGENDAASEKLEKTDNVGWAEIEMEGERVLVKKSDALPPPVVAVTRGAVSDGVAKTL